MSNPLISIITVSYNAANTIEDTIISVINQTYQQIEYIIIDGGSIDETTNIIKKYSNKVTYWVSEKDKGIYDAMNKGISKANGEWLLMLNAGDTLSDKDVLQNIFNSKIPDTTTVLFSDYYTISKKGEKIRCFIDLINKPTSFNHQNTIYRKKLHYEHGFYIVTPQIIISDILFFYSIPKEQLLKIDNVIAVFENGGISSKGNWSNQQWLCADVVFRKRNFYSIFFVYTWRLIKSKIPSPLKNTLKSLINKN